MHDNTVNAVRDVESEIITYENDEVNKEMVFKEILESNIKHMMEKMEDDFKELEE